MKFSCVLLSCGVQLAYKHARNALSIKGDFDTIYHGITHSVSHHSIVANESDAPIQQGQRCYLPNNVKTHASYVHSDSYQKSQGVGGTCDFDSAASFEVSRVLLIQVNSKYIQITMKGKYSMIFDYGGIGYSFFLHTKTLKFQQWYPGGLLLIGRFNMQVKLFIRTRTRGRVLQWWRRLM